MSPGSLHHRNLQPGRESQAGPHLTVFPRFLWPGRSFHQHQQVDSLELFQPLPRVPRELLPSPQVDLPQLDLPQLDLPQLDLPQLDLPQLDLPQLGLPQLGLPQLGLPQLGLLEPRFQPLGSSWQGQPRLAPP